jgi:hypothetical protein
MQVTIPHNYVPRSYQIPFLRAMDGGKKRACLVWHRRSGKSKTLLNFAVKKAMQRVGVYYHAFPEYGQGRKIVWDGIDKEGFRILDHIPSEIRKSENKSEMKIELVNGSIYQIIGADNYNSLVGPNPVGIILDEWAVSDRYPIAWEYFRPILAENGGWAVFPYTPRGRNHGFTLYQMAQRSPDWFCQLLGAGDTRAIPLVEIQKERDQGMSEDMIQQEFYCSFLASSSDLLITPDLIIGAYDRDVSHFGLPRFAGLDVARFGDDRCALVIRQGGDVLHVETWTSTDLVTTAQLARDRYLMGLYDAVAVDAIGIGAGVADMLKAQEIPVVGVNISECASNSNRFNKLRDELWWKVRDWFGDRGCRLSSQLGNDRAALVADVQDIRFSYTPVGKIKIESKEEMKKRLGVSPDIGDALCLTFSNMEHLVERNEMRPFVHNGVLVAPREPRQITEYDVYGGA